MAKERTKNGVNPLKITVFKYGRAEMSVFIGMPCINLSLFK